MGRIGKTLLGLVRPQGAICVFVLLLVCSGGMLSAGAAPTSPPLGKFVVRRPLLPQVQSASVRQPVDCAKTACFALTFDDGPHSVVTPQILDILDRYNVRATFFVVGSHVAGNEALLRRIHTSGHEIGNHSWSHPYFTRISYDQAEAEVATTQLAIVHAGVPAPHIFRPPYGDVNDAVVAHIPLSIIRWNIDPEDWRPTKRQHLLEHMAQHAKPGGMVVLHDTEETTAANLEALIVQLKASNYTLVTVSELLDIPPGQPGVFFGR